MKEKLKITDDDTFSRFLSKERDLADQIINSSRSMISIINRDYIYEKVNATFCNAHQVTIDSIVGKTLEDVWGRDTFNKQIKNNIDLCFSGETVKYEASFKTANSGKNYFEVQASCPRPVVKMNRVRLRQSSSRSW